MHTAILKYSYQRAIFKFCSDLTSKSTILQYNYHRTSFKFKPDLNFIRLSLFEKSWLER